MASWKMLLVKKLPANAEYAGYMRPSIYYWIQFANILLKVLHPLSCDMCVYIVFIWFSDFGVVIEVLTLYLLWIVHRIHLWRHLFIGRFLITFLISVLVISLFLFSISFWISLMRVFISKNLVISSRCVLECNCS